MGDSGLYRLDDASGWSKRYAFWVSSHGKDGRYKGSSICLSTRGFSRLVVESDSQVAIKMVKRERVVAVEVDSILFDIQTAIREFQEVVFIFAPRSCNKATHEVATFACRLGGSYFWNFVPLDWLFNILAGDANVRVCL
ncbi:unnamed protein product [Prunus armeniaca]